MSSPVPLMGDCSDSDDQLDEFIHAYSYRDDAILEFPDEDEVSDSAEDSGSDSEPLLSEEVEDIYDLYNTSTRPSPLPPPSPLLEDDAGLDSASTGINPMLDCLVPQDSDQVLSPKHTRRAGLVGPLAMTTLRAGETDSMAWRVPILDDSSESGAESDGSEDDGEDERRRE
ncbi:unnamed protein product [Mycena citricolor]|uniref:Uncharacterized protein n=1 Tax=Mycena citricolor TaxID=2018698 RepID=A0AAD2H8U4_9AGAR|nr:unnamed protein product [Mycena citricolor]